MKKRKLKKAIYNAMKDREEPEMIMKINHHTLTAKFHPYEPESGEYFIWLETDQGPNNEILDFLGALKNKTEVEFFFKVWKLLDVKR